MLYDPAPRKRGKRKHRTYRRTRSYDPAPRKRKVTAKRTKKGMVGKLRKVVLPGTAGLTFYGAYVKRAEDLFSQGKIPEKSVYKAIEYDIKNFNGKDAMDRLKNQAGEIVVPFLGSWAIKETKLLGKYSGIATDLLAGFGIGTAAKTILDPPSNGSSRTTTRDLIKVRASNKPCGGCQVSDNSMTTQTRQDFNPYGGY